MISYLTKEFAQNTKGKIGISVFCIFGNIFLCPKVTKSFYWKEVFNNGKFIVKKSVAFQKLNNDNI